MSKIISPKEKALELIDRFKEVIPSWSGDPSQAEQIDTDNAKRCALICVEEMINEHTFKSPIGWNVRRLEFWNAVKTEIEKTP